MGIKSYTVLLLLVISSATAQKRLETSIDKTKNKIGAQFNLTIRTEAKSNEKVIFPSGTNFGQLEVIRDYVVDTAAANNKKELIKKYGLTQFDSGRFVIPPLRILINNKPYFTDSISVEVINVAVDTLKQKMFDIKPIIGTESYKMPFWLKLLLGIIVIVGIGNLIYWLVKRHQKSRAQKQVIKTPIERATSELHALETKQLIQKGEIKSYYSELTDIARTYIEEAIHIPAKESTTSDLIAALREVSDSKKISLPEEVIHDLENILRHSDLVKFAKSRPLIYEIESDRNNIEKVIISLDQSVPEISEDEALQQELQRQQLLKKQKRNRMAISLGTVAVLIIGVLFYFLATKGFDSVRDDVLGNPTKKLIENEWISSEYGNPAVAIETPEVLRRTDSEKLLPKDAIALFKEFESFVYGSIKGNFFVAVSTNMYKGDRQIDLHRGIDGMLNALELQGAQNIVVKQDEYKTLNGISGMKAYGSFTIMKDNKKSARHYEALLFGQQNGLQQIVIVYEDGDKYGEAITQRILNSVELKTATAQ